MRLFLYILFFLAYSAVCTWYYVCKIKCLCTLTQLFPYEFVIKDNNNILFRNNENIICDRNNTVPNVPTAIYSLFDSLSLYLANNPDKKIAITSYCSKDELKENPTIAIERAKYIMQLINNKLNDTSQITIQTSPVDELFTNNQTNRAFDFTIINKPLAYNDSVISDTENLITASHNPTNTESDNNVIHQNTNLEKITKTETVPNNNTTILYDENYYIGTYGKYALDDDDNDVLQSLTDNIISILNANENATIEIIGHTCDISGAAFNYGLGMRRAEAIKKYLISKGIESTRIKAISKGLTEPLLPNINKINREKNRRIQIKIINT